jgi:protein KTI12
MALITVTGFPCSGKSTRTEQLRADLENRIKDKDYTGPLKSVIVVSDDTLDVQRLSYDGKFIIALQCSQPNQFSDSKSEKVARATFFAALQRELNHGTVVIADSLNYIKGYRYQMYCAAREQSLRVATVSRHREYLENFIRTLIVLILDICGCYTRYL